jgi:hypothetical protein
MTDRQNAYLNMFTAVAAVIDNHRSEWENIPVFKQQAETFAALIVAIRKKSDERATLTVQAASGEKAEAENAMVEYAVMAARVLNVYAQDTANHTLMQRTGVSKDSFYKATDNASLELARGIAAMMREHAAALAAYGLGAATAGELDSLIAAFEADIAKPRQVLNIRKAKSETLQALFAETKSLIIDRTDKMMALFKTIAPVFYAEYFNARQYINTAARTKKENTGTANSE